MMPFFDENPNPSIPLFAGAVGAMSSAVSVQTGSFLQIFKIPQVRFVVRLIIYFASVTR